MLIKRTGGYNRSVKYLMFNLIILGWTGFETEAILIYMCELRSKHRLLSFTNKYWTLLIIIRGRQRVSRRGHYRIAVIKVRAEISRGLSKYHPQRYCGHGHTDRNPTAAKTSWERALSRRIADGYILALSAA